jgi:hypothetical protein
MKPVTFMPEAIVHSGEGTVRYVVKATAVEAAAVKRAGVKPTRVKPATMEPATTVESSTTVAPTSAMRSVGEVWLAERSYTQHSSCGPFQRPSYPDPGAIFG